MKTHKKLIILFSCISVLLVSSVSMTVAWFISGTTARVTGMEISLNCASKDFQISLSEEAGTFKQFITREEIGELDGFVPVTTMYSSEWIQTKSPEPHFKANPTMGGEYPTVYDANGGYFCRLFYFDSNADVYLTIDAENTILEGDPDKNYQTAVELLPKYEETETLETLLAKLNRIKNTLRISILVPDEDHYQYTIINPFIEGTTYQAGVLDTNSDGYFDYYKNPYTGERYETAYGEILDRSKLVYNDPVDHDTESSEVFVAKHRAKVHTLNRQASIENGAGFVEEKALSLEEAESQILIPAYAHDPSRSKAYVSIFLEGWDMDTINSTMYASFISTIKFKISREM